MTRPGSRQRVVEIDQPLTDLVRQHLPLPRGARIRVRADDARVGLAALHPSSADVVVCDVFAGARTPGAPHQRGVRRRRAPGPATGRGLRGQRGRRPTAAVRPRTGRHPALALPARLPARRAGHAPRTQVRQPGRRRVGRRTARSTTTSAAAPATRCPSRVVHGADLVRFAGTALPVPDAEAVASPEPPGRRLQPLSAASKAASASSENSTNRTSVTCSTAAARTPATACRAASSSGQP